MNNQSIKKVEEDLQELRNKWIAKGETESFVNTVISKYAKMISLPVERIADEEMLALAEDMLKEQAEADYKTSHGFAATFDKLDGIPFVRRRAVCEIMVRFAKAIRDKLQSSSVKDGDEK